MNDPKQPIAPAHTAGPWRIATKIDHRDAFTICGHGDVTIALVSSQDPQEDGGRCFATEGANARLIAAAPELLEHAAKLVAFITRSPALAPAFGLGVRGIHIDHSHFYALSTAIARAEGKAE
jgi:hypothetical protein